MCPYYIKQVASNIIVTLIILNCKTDLRQDQDSKLHINSRLRIDKDPSENEIKIGNPESVSSISKCLHRVG